MRVLKSILVPAALAALPTAEARRGLPAPTGLLACPG